MRRQKVDDRVDCQTGIEITTRSPQGPRERETETNNTERDRERGREMEMEGPFALLPSRWACSTGLAHWNSLEVPQVPLVSQGPEEAGGLGGGGGDALRMLPPSP